MAQAFIVASPEPLSGKSTIAAGLARRFPGAAVTEVPAGERPAPGDARVIVVATPAAEGLEAFCAEVGDRLAGVVLNRVPVKRADRVRARVEASGLKVLAVVPEDRLLAAPALRDVINAIDAQVKFLDGSEERVIERPAIASISADPGQGYFAMVNPSAVIVRSDKPDLQLSALNAGATCLIITGGYPILSYVLDRAESGEIPILTTQLDTVRTMEAIESLYAGTPFAGGEAKTRRIAELLADLDAVLA